MYVATLACRSLIDGERHTVTFRSSPPFIAEKIYCVKCEEYSRVVEAPYMHEARCLSCTYKGGRSVRPSVAQSFAQRHADGHPSHRVTTRLGRAVTETWEPRDDTLKISFQNLLTARGR